MVYLGSILPYQPSQPINAEWGPQRRKVPRHRKMGAAVVGLLLAAGAGVSTHRQITSPTDDADNTTGDASPLTTQGQRIDQGWASLTFSRPVVGSEAGALSGTPTAHEQMKVAGQTILPPSSDAALGIERTKAATRAPIFPDPGQPGAGTNGTPPSGASTSATSIMAQATAPSVSELPKERFATLHFAFGEEADTTPVAPAMDNAEEPAESVYGIDDPVADTKIDLNSMVNSVEPITEAQAFPSDSVAVAAASLALPTQTPTGDRITLTSEATMHVLPTTLAAEERPWVAAAASAENDSAMADTMPMLVDLESGPKSTSGRSRNEDGPAIIAAEPVAAPIVLSAAPGQAMPSGEYVQRFPMVVLDGTRLGAITVREFSEGHRLIHLGTLLSLFRSKMEPAEYERLISSGSADQFLSLAELRRRGLNARYDYRRGRLAVESTNTSGED